MEAVPRPVSKQYTSAVVLQVLAVIDKMACLILLIFAWFSHTWIVNHGISEKFILTRDIFGYDCAYYKDFKFFRCIASKDWNEIDGISYYSMFHVNIDNLNAPPFCFKKLGLMFYYLLIGMSINVICSFIACCVTKDLLPRLQRNERKWNIGAKFFLFYFILDLACMCDFFYIIFTLAFSKADSFTKPEYFYKEIFGNAFFVLLYALLAFLTSAVLMFYTLLVFIHHSGGIMDITTDDIPMESRVPEAQRFLNQN